MGSPSLLENFFSQSRSWDSGTLCYILKGLPELELVSNRERNLNEAVCFYLDERIQGILREISNHLKGHS